MYERHILGKNGEDIVETYLKNKGYKILERNFECRQGEIDIIALDKKELVFIEVKTRRTFTYGMPADSVNITKQKHIYNTAKYYLYSRNLLDEFVRIDVIEVLVDKFGYKINHIKQAF